MAAEPCKEHATVTMTLGSICVKLEKIEGMNEKIIQALYGTAGELDGSGVGLVARTQQLTERIDAVEEMADKAKATIKDIIVAVLPYVVGTGGIAAAIAAILGAK